LLKFVLLIAKLSQFLVLYPGIPDKQLLFISQQICIQSSSYQGYQAILAVCCGSRLATNLAMRLASPSLTWVWHNMSQPYKFLGYTVMFYQF
jgi:hypothetical protein